MKIAYLIFLSLITINVSGQNKNKNSNKLNVNELSLNNFENKYFIDTTICENHAVKSRKIKFNNLNFSVSLSDSITRYEIDNFSGIEVMFDKNIDYGLSILESKNIEPNDNYMIKSFKYNILNDILKQELVDFGSCSLKNLGKIYWAKLKKKFDTIQFYVLEMMFKHKSSEKLFLISISSTKKKYFDEVLCKSYPIIKSIEVN